MTEVLDDAEQQAHKNNWEILQFQIVVREKTLLYRCVILYRESPVMDFDVEFARAIQTDESWLVG